MWQVVEERDCIALTAVGGVRINHKTENSRRLIFHSALQPSVEQFNIKGTDPVLRISTNRRFVGQGWSRPKPNCA